MINTNNLRSREQDPLDGHIVCLYQGI